MHNVPMTTAQTTTCSKCDGKGRINAFSHIENGSCFACKGTGTITRSKSTVTRHARKLRQVDAAAANRTCWACGKLHDPQTCAVAAAA